MAVIKRNVVSGDIEKRIITGIITNDNFCSKMQKMAVPKFFKIDYAKTIFEWASDYYRSYKKAPGKEIRNIFAVEQDRIKEADAELIRSFLADISAAYAKGEYEKANFDLLSEHAKDYCRERSLELAIERIQGHLSRGKLDEAESEMRSYNKITKGLSEWFNPLDPQNIKQVFEEDKENILFRLPGPLGEMAGDFERDWLIAFMAPMKRGKSWILQEFAVHALMA